MGEAPSYDLYSRHERLKLWESFTCPCDHPDLRPKCGGIKAVSLHIPALEQGVGWQRGIGMAVVLATFNWLEELSIDKLYV